MQSHACFSSAQHLPPALPPADIPLTKAVAGVRVGYLPSAGFIINPSAAQMAQSQLDLLMAGTAEAVLMIEGFCDWLTEDQMLEVRLLHMVLYCCYSFDWWC
jgi:polyribonucleotide nucleotidyltransferase